VHSLSALRPQEASPGKDFPVLPAHDLWTPDAQGRWQGDGSVNRADYGWKSETRQPYAEGEFSSKDIVLQLEHDFRFFFGGDSCYLAA
jgi:hypothetical protein